MTVQVMKFARKPFFVDAVQVTDAKLDEIAKWCDGEVLETTQKGKGGKDKEPARYIKVRVLRPMNEKQTMAFPGDWILHAGTGYKVYTSKSFFENFEMAEPLP